MTVISLTRCSKGCSWRRELDRCLDLVDAAIVAGFERLADA